MSDNKNRDLFDDFFGSVSDLSDSLKKTADFTQDIAKPTGLEDTIARNQAGMTELLGRGDSRLNDIVTDVYKDFFGNDFVDRFNDNKGADADTALKNAITNALYAPVENALPRDTAAPASDATALPDQNPSSGNPAGPSAAAGAAPSAAGDQAQARTAEAQTEKKPEKSGMEQLEELIGLDSIKHDVRELVNLVKIQKLREEKGLAYVPTSLHLVFAGNPGTGKTTVARILAQLYKEIGVLSKGQLVEVDRSGLVAGYVGQTAIKTQEKIKEAMGGVLFIDEAYALNKEGPDYGQEAIDTILKAMEDNRKDFVVIAAGYTELMERFINSNPGLKSRFNKYLTFPDYTAEEMMAIFDINCKKYSYTLSDEARTAVEALIREREANKGENFANARDVRNIFEAIITNQASRVAALENPSEEDITTILPEDLSDFS